MRAPYHEPSDTQDDDRNTNCRGQRNRRSDRRSCKTWHVDEKGGSEEKRNAKPQNDGGQPDKEQNVPSEEQSEAAVRLRLVHSPDSFAQRLARRSPPVPKEQTVEPRWIVRRDRRLHYSEGDSTLRPFLGQLQDLHLEPSCQCPCRPVHEPRRRVDRLHLTRFAGYPFSADRVQCGAFCD